MIHMKRNFWIIIGVLILLAISILIFKNRPTVTSPVVSHTQQIQSSQVSTDSKYPVTVQNFINNQKTGAVYSISYNGKSYYSIQSSSAADANFFVLDMNGNFVTSCLGKPSTASKPTMCDQLMKAAHTLIWKQ